MSKAPAFQFYPADYLKDPELGMASWATRGIWMALLCRMWDATPRGVLSGTPANFARLIGCTEAEFETFRYEAVTLKFADVTPASDDGHGVVTLVNRRMVRDEKQRKDSAFRQIKHRSLIESRDCHVDVTLESRQSNTGSSSSSSSSDPEEELDHDPDLLLDSNKPTASRSSLPRPSDAASTCSDQDLNLKSDPDRYEVHTPTSELTRGATAPLVLTPETRNGRPPPKVKPAPKLPDLWDPDDAPFVEVLRTQPLFDFQILDSPTWWANQAEIVGGLTPAWLALQFKAMEAKFIAGYRKPVGVKRNILGFIGRWMANARETERRRDKWQGSPPQARR